MERAELVAEILKINPQRLEMMLDDLDDGYLDVSMKTEREIAELCLNLALSLVNEFNAFIDDSLKGVYSDLNSETVTRMAENRFIHKYR